MSLQRLKRSATFNTVKSHCNSVCSRGGLAFNTADLTGHSSCKHCKISIANRNYVFLDEQFETPHANCRFTMTTF